MKPKDGRASLVSPIFLFLRKEQITVLNNGREIDFDLEKNMKNTDILDFMPSFDYGEQNEISVIVNTKEYRVTR